MERVYTVPQVERILRSYLDIRHVLLGKAQQGMESIFVDTPINREPDQVPWGMRPTDPPWPFMMAASHAKSPRDGKARARRMEELHCVVIDIDLALKAKHHDGSYRISEDDFFLLSHYYVYQTVTLDELCVLRGSVSRGSMQRRCQRAVARLVEELERAK